MVDDARIPAKATNDERVSAEVAADKFALDSRLGNLELKPMVMFAYEWPFGTISSSMLPGIVSTAQWRLPGKITL